MTDRRLTLMAVHAHPDDEATGTGGVLARYAAEGIETVLVTCTDGSCGDGAGGVKPGEPGHDPAEVVAVRTAELRASCKVLNVSHLELLGYADSGMQGWPQNSAPGSFWSTPLEEPTARLAALITKYQPDVIVTYDANGFYGHPDHIQTHRVTMAAVEATGTAAKVYWTTAPYSGMTELAKVMRQLGADWEESDERDLIGVPDDQVTTWVDTTAFNDQKFDSLAAHASQGDNIFFLQMGRKLFGEMMGIETFLRVQDRTQAPLPEDDLFAGLR